MRIPTLLSGALVALIALFGVGLHSANADSGSMTLTIYKGGWIIGGLAGGGRSPSAAAAMGLESAAVKYGLEFGGSRDRAARSSAQHPTRVRRCRAYVAAAGAGLAVGRGVRAIVLTNQNRAILELSGRQVGLMRNAI